MEKYTKEDYNHYAKCDKKLDQCSKCAKIWGYVSKIVEKQTGIKQVSRKQ